jgi:hemoglobin
MDWIERSGYPFLRRRYLSFKIGEEERDQWIYCMTKGMHNIKMDEAKIKALLNALYPIADLMRYQAIILSACFTFCSIWF